MIGLSAPSVIMTNDERVLVTREASDLGGDTIILDGKRVKRGTWSFGVDCNVQPMTGEELIQLGEGDRFNEMIWLYVADSALPLQVNDLVYRPGDAWYQVQASEGWGSYSRCRAAQLDVQPVAPSSNLLLANQIG